MVSVHGERAAIHRGHARVMQPELEHQFALGDVLRELGTGIIQLSARTPACVAMTAMTIDSKYSRSVDFLKSAVIRRPSPS